MSGQVNESIGITTFLPMGELYSVRKKCHVEGSGRRSIQYGARFERAV